MWRKLAAGLVGLDVATPTAAARRRVGVGPLHAMFDLLHGPAAGPATNGVWWRGLLVCALDGATLACPDSAANLTVFHKGGGHHGGTGYPLVWLLALVACGIAR
jgi:hypothetical protein